MSTTNDDDENAGVQALPVLTEERLSAIAAGGMVLQIEERAMASEILRARAEIAEADKRLRDLIDQATRGLTDTQS